MTASLEKKPQEPKATTRSAAFHYEKDWLDYFMLFLIGIGIPVILFGVWMLIQEARQEKLLLASGLPEAFHEIADNGLAPDRISDRTERARGRDQSVRRSLEVSFDGGSLKELRCTTYFPDRLAMSYVLQGTDGEDLRRYPYSDGLGKRMANDMAYAICRRALRMGKEQVAGAGNGFALDEF